ncbi:MAG: zinc metallopeptidase [Eubacteriales bacterium]|nr:zinc metallopeptidase [Eubacteriales bacterium]
MYLDYLYLIIVLPCVIFALIAQMNVSRTFNKYSAMITSSGMTGYDSARMILDRNGLYNVRIDRVSGNLTDHYDPRDNVIRLSDTVYDARTPAALGVAAHEAGHALQYANNYIPMRIRGAIIPVTNFCSKWSMLLILIGIVFLYVAPFAFWIMLVGIIFFSTSTLFQLVTLPVEFNASRRAMKCLSESGMLDGGELRAARKVLTAAAMTYVAALAVSFATLMRYAIILMSGSGKRRR